mgnify:CR=1 FL=1
MYIDMILRYLEAGRVEAAYFEEDLACCRDQGRGQLDKRPELEAFLPSSRLYKHYDKDG